MIRKMTNIDDKNFSIVLINGNTIIINDNINVIVQKFIKKRKQKCLYKAFHNFKKTINEHCNIRKDLLLCFDHYYLEKRFHGWKITIKKSIYLKKCIKRYWRIKQNQLFKWWKYCSRWRTMRLTLLHDTLYAWIFDKIKHDRAISKLRNLFNYYNRKKGIMIILYNNIIIIIIIIIISNSNTRKCYTKVFISKEAPLSPCNKKIHDDVLLYKGIAIKEKI